MSQAAAKLQMCCCSIGDKAFDAGRQAIVTLLLSSSSIVLGLPAASVHFVDLVCARMGPLFPDTDRGVRARVGSGTRSANVALIVFSIQSPAPPKIWARFIFAIAVTVAAFIAAALLGKDFDFGEDLC